MNKMIAILAALTMVLTMFAPVVSAQEITLNVDVSNQGIPPIINYQFALSINENTGDIIPGDDGTLIDTVTQVMPIAGVGLVESQKHFRKYVVVSDPSGISNIASVFEQLRDPNGIGMIPEVLATDITGDEPQWTAAINQAYLDNLITLAAKLDMLDKLRAVKAQYKIYVVDNYLTNHDAPGNYQVYFKVVNKQGAFMENTNVAGGGPGALIVEYMTLKAFQTDFSVVPYGPVQVNIRKVVAGDEDWLTPLRPTVKNQGNVPVQLQVSASDLRGITPPQQTISASALSIHLLGIDLNGLSNTPQILTNPIMPCTPTQVDFDITVPYGTSSNSYSGSLTLAMV